MSDGPVPVPGEIITLTPSPVIDRTYVVDGFAPYNVHRAAASREELGGNGVNISRALEAHGMPSTALVPMLPSSLDINAPTWIMPVPTPLPPRVNTIIVEQATGRTTNVNQRPQPLSDDVWGHIVASTEAVLANSRAAWLVISGALPEDAATGRAVQLTALVQTARRHGVRVAVDVPGEWLLDALDPDNPVDVIKPNLDELERATGASARTWADMIAGCRLLHARGARTVLLSLGSEGMLAVGPEGTHRARSARVEVRNTTGAGDAALAGYLAALADGADAQAAVVQAADWGTRAVQSPHSGVAASAVAAGGLLAESVPLPGRPPQGQDLAAQARSSIAGDRSRACALAG